MNWLESQIETRERLDVQLTERAYAELAASVSEPYRAPSFTVDDIEQVDGAIKTCLKYCRSEPGNVPDGVNSLEERIDYLCRPTGTMHRSVNLDEGWHTRAFGAMLGKLESGEAIALLPYGVRGYYYLEPGTGRKVKVNDSIAQNISSDAVLFYRPLPVKSLKVIDLVRFIISIFDRNDYMLVFAAALVMMLVGLVPAWANQIAFGTVVPSGQVGLVLPVGALLLGVAITTALIGATRTLIMSRISIKLDVITEAATFSRLLALPSSFFKKYSSGNLGNRVSNITMLAQEMASILLGSGLSAFLSLAYVVQIGMYAPALAIPALIIALIQGGLTVVAAYLIRHYEQATLKARASLSGVVTALLNGVQKIKLAGAENRAFAHWASSYADYARTAYNRPALLLALPAVVGVVGLLGNIVLYYLASTSGVSVANYMAFTAAYGQITGAIMTLSTIAGDLAQIDPMLDMVAPILEETPETSEDKPSVASLSGAIDVSGVWFSYGDNSPYVVKDLSFKVRPGEYVALVGKSGCGKSTIMRLLLGFETPERGTISYGPHDIQKVDLRSLRQNIGVVMQDGKLFMGDIASNITISSPQATIDDAWEAAEIAGIAEDIRKMPMGMQTFVTEGSGGVSGGQRQRLMIARAVCGKRRLLMFDEATSALDNKTQKHVADSLEALQCTRVVVAHRLSTVRHCDRILVVDDGRIAEEGTYEELIAKNGIFAGLVERQRLDKES
ncbi:MAG: ATP-binding cassette domain-containing protein [Eggerthellaceae bacterium]|nr:ATP-binding cassette domain-containing protein [Eggerthellaceae bacterium]